MRLHPIAYALLAVLGVAIYASAQRTFPPPGSPEETMKIFNSEIDGELWLEYTMGETTHHIRGRTIHAIVWTDDQQRNTIFFDGGKLSNNISHQQYLDAVVNFQKNQARGLER